MLNVIMLNVVKLNVILLSVMLNLSKLNVVMLNVIMLRVAVPSKLMVILQPSLMHGNVLFQRGGRIIKLRFSQ
jgi:hypothetical protein